MLGAVAADADVQRIHGAVILLEGPLAAAAPAVGDGVADEEDADLAVFGGQVLEEALVALEEAVVGVVGVALDGADVGGLFCLVAGGVRLLDRGRRGGRG